MSTFSSAMEDSLAFGPLLIPPSLPTPACEEWQTLDLIVELNNEGASHLESCFYSEAIAAISSALTISMQQETSLGGQLRTALQDIPLLSRECVSTTNDNQNNADLEASNDSVASRPKKTKRRKQQRRSSVGSKDSSVARPTRRERRRELNRRRLRSIRSRMAKFMESVVTEDVYQEPKKHVHTKPLRVMDRYNIPSASELAIHMIYNLALAHHLQLSAMGEDDLSQQQKETGWKVVIKLYTLASSMVEEEQALQDQNECVSNPCSPIWSLTYTLALPNNLACAFDEAGSPSKADLTWQQVLRILWCIVDMECAAQVTCLADVLMNVSKLLGADADTMPAAAA